MKKLMFIVCTAVLAISCNDSGTATSTESKSGDSSKMTTTSGNLEYPYTLERPYMDWQPGDKQHAVTAMKALKGYETGDVAGIMQYFGDTVDIRFDNFRAKLSNDSLKKMFTKDRADMASFKVVMGDWESVISGDKKEQWVTMWYKQIWTDKKGKTDSLAVVDDAKIENGKITQLDEKIQHFPAKK